MAGRDSLLRRLEALERGRPGAFLLVWRNDDETTEQAVERTMKARAIIRRPASVAVLDLEDMNA